MTFGDYYYEIRQLGYGRLRSLFLTIRAGIVVYR